MPSQCRQVTRGKAKSGGVVQHQRKLVVLKTISNVKGHLRVVLRNSTAL